MDELKEKLMKAGLVGTFGQPPDSSLFEGLCWSCNDGCTFCTLGCSSCSAGCVNSNVNIR